MVNQWYVVHTYSGHEDKVKKNLEMAITNLNMHDVISQILVPTEEVVEVKQNKKRIKRRKFYPGYVFVEMTVNNTTFWLIRNTVGVTGFLGGVKPVPMAQNEVESLLDIVINPDASKPRPAVSFEKEENVRIIEGPFKHFIGIVDEINHERGKLRVMVTIFGRPTPVELDFLQVEKM
ncbi:transcription termination/antitermination protein NusG [Candidatus Endomicrobiellum agilis]|jgi:transcriptional antiterminator NusG|uniref:transcription termination/antitermination protein NusG n=1 Tax=Candidatus Endomicrobiellum agilis TaxID=3238957 RepID=UPI0028490033|nr:transcription termination/antitermination protein NusG [Endomicrobium sp.]MDR3092483.1 transcription termination/antitermination protein NusG [Endomicrobium sp.]